MKQIKIIIAVIMVLAFVSCEKPPDCFKGTGPLTTQERPTAVINRLELRCNADVIIHPDTINRIKVTAGANLIDKIETEIKDNTLTIRNHNKCNWVRSFNPHIVVEVWTDDLTYIRADDANGDITFSDTLHVHEFTFDSYASLGKYYLKLDAYVATLALHNGPADFYGTGKITVAYYYSNGYGIMDFRDILTEKIYMNNRGSNDMFVYAEMLLEAKIEYSGNIYYRGNPSLQSSITGSGKILPLQ